MNAVTVMPRSSGAWTIDDLAVVPDDGLPYELLDGLLLVTPAPTPEHQRYVREIFLLLHEACPANFEVFFAPLDWQPDSSTSLHPDVLVAHRADVTRSDVSLPAARDRSAVALDASKGPDSQTRSSRRVCRAESFGQASAWGGGGKVCAPP